MNRWLMTALAASFAVAAGAGQAETQDRDHGTRTQNTAVPPDHSGSMRLAADERRDTEKKVTVRHKPHETVRRTVTERPNGNVVRRTVTERANGNRNVRVTRRVFRAPHRFHARRPWIAPRGFVYRRFSLGERVPAVLLAADYFLADYFSYGLTPPPPGYVWVRDGSDAVLVDRYTGEVVQVAYDVFY